MTETTRQYSNSNTIILTWVTAADFIAMNLLLAFFIRLFPSQAPESFQSSLRITLLMANLSMLIAQIPFHTIIHRRLVRIEQIATNVLKLVVMHVVIMFITLKFISLDGGFFRFSFLFMATEYVLLCLLRIAEREVLVYYRRRRRNTRHVIFVGDDRANLAIYNELASDPSTGYRAIGYYGNSRIPGAPAEFKYLGTISQLNTDMNNAFKISDITSDTVITPNDREDNHHYLSTADELFCSLSHSDYNEIVRIMRFCDSNIIRFFYVPRVFGNYRLNLKPERFGNSIIYTDHPEPLTRPVNKFIKRAFDIIVSAIVCLLMLPFLPIIALIIYIQSPGPPFFTQMRTGLNGVTFKCYKFRSMHINKNADEQQATKDDPRKFPFGNFMRRTNIDEFPQFYNVLKGDMSIVGPRPHMLHHTEMYSGLIDKYMVRHFCKPGITGWAQVTGYRGETKELWQMEERVRRDIWYVEHWSFWLDLKIIFLTAKSIFVPDKNAY